MMYLLLFGAVFALFYLGREFRPEKPIVYRYRTAEPVEIAATLEVIDIRLSEARAKRAARSIEADTPLVAIEKARTA